MLLSLQRGVIVQNNLYRVLLGDFSQCEFSYYQACLLFVLSLLEDRVTRLHGQLQRHQQQLIASPGSGSVDNKVLDDLYEDIHWLILVTGE